MKNFFVSLLCFVGLTLVASGCGQKTKAELVIDGFEDLIVEVEDKKGKLTVEEWVELEKNFNTRFEELGIEEINEDEFSTFQKLELAALMMRWTAAMAESAPTLLESGFEQAENELNKTN